jgi:oxygen-independent coproporphyrinogen-3 oxidase
MPVFGLYIHIPFCTAVCHYCDFAKTARYGASEQELYLQALLAEWQDWASWCNARWPEGWRLSSLYFGGGTPSVYGAELEPLFALLRPFLEPKAEITFEVNPEHVDRPRLYAWRQLGINRLSLGVQSFEAAGLTFLTRHHSAEQARKALELSLGAFDDVSLDLIYGWQGQTMAQWEHELNTAVATGVSHASLYVLTYAAGTPHGRRAERGVLVPTEDQELESRYEAARHILGAAGYAHEEVSNWAREPYFARHNKRYWQQEPYLALGLGAHGFLPTNGPLGWRFFHPNSLRGYLGALTQQPVITTVATGMTAAEKSSLEIPEKIVSRWHIESDERAPDDWLLEALGSGLRCQYGVDLQEIQTKTGQVFKPTAYLSEQLSAGRVLFLEQGRLRLSQAEWFRETAWCHEILKAFDTP